VSRPAANTMIVEAPAKVNLFLRVLGIRPDGFHELETLILPISLADQVEVHAAADPNFRTLSLSLDVSGEDELVRGVPRDEANLVMRAGLALAERTGVLGFADIALDKRIPPAAGLGGGSSDAAAALAALNELWECGLDGPSLREVGGSVGSDVPALMLGGPALARGRGEQVEVAAVCPLSLVVVTFPFGVSTPEAFRWWDEAGAPTGPEPGPLLEAARLGMERVAGSLFNDLEAPVVRRHPEIAEAKRSLLDGGALGAVMSGSGPTVFGVLAGPDARVDRRIEEEIVGLTGRPPAYVTAKGSRAR